MTIEYIDKDFFKDPKKIGIPMVTMTQKSGTVSFNLAAKARFGLDNYEYLMFARCPESNNMFYVIPTDDKNKGWKITKYKNHVNTYLKICSQQLVGLVSRAVRMTDQNLIQFYMHETDRLEKGFPMFSLTVKNY